MKRTLMALSGMLAFALACGDGRTSDQDTGAAGTGAESGAVPPGGSGIEDTTAAPSTDVGVPTTDTAADTGAPAGTGGSGAGGSDSLPGQQ